MDWGLKNRLAKIINPTDGKGVMLAVDHGYFLGPTEKLESPRKTIRPLLKHSDSLMITRGVLRTSVDANFPIPIVLRVSGGTSIIGEDLSNEQITTSVKDAIRVNATALAMSVFVGGKYEHQTIVNLGKLVNEAEEYGIPVLAVTAVGKELARDARYLSLACRVAAEQGAHVVKTYYCENFEKVVESCPVPVIIAGGKKLPERDALELTYKAIKAGASGVDMGRNIWQSDFPVPMIRAVRAIVHGHATLEQAYRLYQNLCQEQINNKSKQQNFSKGKRSKNKKNRKKFNKSKNKKKSKPQNKPQNKPKTKSKPKSKPQNKPQNKPKTKSKPKSKPQNKPQNKPKTKSKPKSKPQNKTKSKPKSKPQKKSKK